MMTMRHIFGSIVKKQASGEKWIISEVIVYTVRVYIYYSGDDVDEVLKVELYHMVEDQDGLGETRQLRGNLEETHMKMREKVKIKLAKYLDPLLEAPSSDKYHWWFSLMINPHNVNEFMDVIKLHDTETVDTRSIIN